MLKARALILALLAVAALCGASFAEELTGEGTHISADTIEQIGSIFYGEGSVVIQSDGSTLTSDRVRYDSATEEVVAEGDVRFEDERASLTASKAEINLGTETGVIHDADVLFKEQSYRVSGPRIEKRSANQYFLDTGSLTTCTGLVPAWCVKGRNIDLIVGDRIKSKHATFQVKGHPVLYTPYFWAPVVVERRTGFLFPEVGYSSTKGFTWRQPFFWAISKNRDATFYTDLYAKRGVGLGAEYRYIEAPGVEGSVNFFHIRDTELHRNFRELRANHRHAAGRFRGFYDVNYVNQKDFYREYKPYLPQSSHRFLESQAEASLNTSHARFYADARYLRELDESQDQKLVVQKLPEAGAFLKPLALGPVVVTADAAAANFERGSGAGGHRFDADLKLQNTVGSGPSFSQGVDLRYILYELSGVPAGERKSFGRGSVGYSAEARTSFSKDFGEVEHIVLPAVSYSYRDIKHETPPLFDSKELLDDVSSLGLSITNRLRDRRGEFLTVRLSESYDFLKDDDNLGPVVFDASYSRDFSVAMGLSYDVHERAITGSNSSLGVKRGPVEVSGGHSYAKGGITMYNASVTYKATPEVSFKSAASYDSTGGNLARLNLGMIYDSQCWALSVDYTKRPGESIVFLTLTLKGIGDVIRI